jgi:AraC-like DNA-binding protein
MQVAANKNLFIPGSSSELFFQSRPAPTLSTSGRRTCLSLLRGYVDAESDLFSLGWALTEVARRAYLLREHHIVAWASQTIRDLPLPSRLQTVSDYYSVYCEPHSPEQSRAILADVADQAAPGLRERAILGIAHAYFGSADFVGSAYFYADAARASASTDLFVQTEACRTMAACRGALGDHRGALRDLQKLWPVIHSLSRTYPTLYYDYLNSLAVELGELRKFPEARAAIAIALSSPFAAVYPNWRETKMEIEEAAAKELPKPSPAYVIVVPPAPTSARAATTARTTGPATSVALIDPGLRLRAKLFVHSSILKSQLAVTPILERYIKCARIGDQEAAQREAGRKYRAERRTQPASRVRCSAKPRGASPNESLPPRMREPGAVCGWLRHWDHKRCGMIERMFACVHPRDGPIVSGFRLLFQQRWKSRRSRTARLGRVQARAPPGGIGVFRRNSSSVVAHPFQFERGRIRCACSYWCAATSRSRAPPYPSRRQLRFLGPLPALSCWTRQRAQHDVRALLLAHPNRKHCRGRCDSADQPKWQADGCSRGKFHPSASAGHTSGLRPVPMEDSMTISRGHHRANQSVREPNPPESSYQGKIEGQRLQCSGEGTVQCSDQQLTEMEKNVFTWPLLELAARLSGDTRLARAWSLIETQYADSELRLDSAARDCGVSPDHLNVILRRSTGLTFHQILVRYRLLKALTIMRKGNWTALDIALDVGFGSVSAFQRNFRRIFGAAPKEFQSDWTGK